MKRETFRFLDLFPEIRDQIYMVILSFPPNELPTLPPSDICRKRGSRTFFECCNKYPIDPPEVFSASLLLCNRQIHVELKDCIARFLVLTTLRYDLDCVLADEQYIYPTWLRIPVSVNHIPCVYTTFRLSGTFIAYPGKRSGWRGGDRGPSDMIWSLHALLKRFLISGPPFLSTSKARTITVGDLVLDVITPTLRLGESFKDPEEYDFVMYGPPNRTMIHPDTVVQVLRGHIQYLFGGSKHTLEYGKFVASRVQSIKLFCDGQRKACWDLQAMKHLH